VGLAGACCRPMVISLAEARAAGLTRDQLQGRRWRRVGYALYAPSDTPVDAGEVMAALARRLPAEAAFSGLSAAWLHGLDVQPGDPCEVTVPVCSGVSAAAGLRVRRAQLPDDDVVVRRSLRTTCLPRTLTDLAWRLPVEDAVAITDMALHAQLTDFAQIRRWVEQRPVYRGRRRLRTVLDLADDGAESPMESRLRVLLVRAGLPRPLTQVKLYDAAGGFLGRVDLYYPQARLAIEYDGDNHRERLLADNRRQNAMLRAGVRLLRYCAADVLGIPFVVVAQVREALAIAESVVTPDALNAAKFSKTQSLSPV
jgi:very-short-patch-repair endonuclease